MQKRENIVEKEATKETEEQFTEEHQREWDSFVYMLQKKTNYSM